MRGLDLLGDTFIRLFGALPDCFRIPGEPVLPNVAALVDAHRYAPALSTSHDIGRVVQAHKSTANLDRRRIIVAVPQRKHPSPAGA